MTLLTTRGIYGTIAMTEIAKGSENSPISIQKIADVIGTTKGYLEQIINNLRNAGLIISIRGANGGYYLSKSPSNISFGEIFTAIEGDFKISNIELKGGEYSLLFNDIKSKIEKVFELKLSEFPKYVEKNTKFLDFVI